jgi:hypothetical protein
VLTFVTTTETPPFEVRVNFGVYAGRSVTPAEIDDLARRLLPEIGEVTIVSEDRHDVSERSETSLHQVRIELPDGADTDRIVGLVEQWAEACIAERHADVAEV